MSLCNDVVTVTSPDIVVGGATEVVASYTPLTDVEISAGIKDYIISSDGGYIPGMGSGIPPLWLQDFIGVITGNALAGLEGQVGSLSDSLLEAVDNLNIANNNFVMTAFNLSSSIGEIHGAIEQINSNYGDAMGQITNLRVTMASEDRALAAQINQLVARVGSAEASINQLDYAMAGTLQPADIEDLKNYFGEDFNERIDQMLGEDGAISVSIRENTAQYDDAFAQVEQYQAAFATQNGIAAAVWGVDMNAGGLVSGLRMINDGNSADIVFDVDKFQVGRSGSDGVAPFEVIGNNTYIKQAYIPTITTSLIKTPDGYEVFDATSGTPKLKVEYLDVGSLNIDTTLNENTVVGQYRMEITPSLIKISDKDTGFVYLRLGIW